MLVVLLLHAGLTALTASLAGRWGPKVFLIAALAPLSGVVLLVAAAPTVLDGGAWTQVVPWIPGLDLSVALRLDALSLAMLVLVSGVGTVIFVFCAGYASRDGTLVRFVSTLTAFAGAMVGLVLADDVILLYVFWELTTVTSYLLVGLDDEDAAARRSALQALLVTTFGGLAMLVGLIVLSQAAGTSRISQIVESPPSGPTVAPALVLVLVGALSKAAQVPFHPWLPAAMAAPTPVSAYLHAAAMVKAGVYLVARLSPGFADVAWWRPVVVTVGVATMLLGGWRALRQHDLKRLLAFSTVSQLGFLVAIAGWGTAEAAVATTVLLLAHGLAKAALFLTVGAIDHVAHTRDLRLLDGLGRRMPLLAVAAGAAALSLGGVPLLLGFVAKEEVFAAVADTPGTVSVLTLAGLVVGSALSLAYALRFWWGAFAAKTLPEDDPDAVPAGESAVGDVPSPAAGLTGPVVLLSAATVVLGVAPQAVDRLAAAVAASYPEAEPTADLALWHGLTPELALSLVALALGASLFAGRRRVAGGQTELSQRLPARFDADRGYVVVVRGLDRAADGVTGRIQTGSLPVYLGVIAATAAVLPGTALVWRGADLGGAVAYDVPAQVAVGGLVAAAAIAAAVAQNRLTAVLLLGAVGYGVALLYVLQGGPDLALTQFLVETLSVVIFLLVLRLLPRRFPVTTAGRRAQTLRLVLAATVGVVVTLFTLAATGARSRVSVAEEFVARSRSEAGGSNIVNVILVDFRGLDTLGEATVVLTAALGIAALVLTARRQRDSTGSPDSSLEAAEEAAGDSGPDGGVEQPAPGAPDRSAGDEGRAQAGVP